MYYPSSENKGADQLRSYCEADLRLCFRLGKSPVLMFESDLLLTKLLRAQKIQSHDFVDFVMAYVTMININVNVKNNIKQQ